MHYWEVFNYDIMTDFCQKTFFLNWILWLTVGEYRTLSNALFLVYEEYVNSIYMKSLSNLKCIRWDCQITYQTHLKGTVPGGYYDICYECIFLTTLAMQFRFINIYQNVYNLCMQRNSCVQSKITFHMILKLVTDLKIVTSVIVWIQIVIWSVELDIPGIFSLVHNITSLTFTYVWARLKRNLKKYWTNR